MKPRTLRNLTIALAVLFLLCMPSVASADNVTWDVISIASTDGGSFSGSFVYNADTNTYSSIDIVTTAGTLLNGATYTNLDPNVFEGVTSNDEFLILVANTSLAAGTPVLGMEFGGLLTDAGGEFLMLGIEGFCNTGCTNLEGESDAREFEGVVASSPEPSSLLLLSFGLFGLMGVAKRKVMHA